MEQFYEGDKVIFRENTTGDDEPGTVTEKLPRSESHPNGGLYTVELDDGTSVEAWFEELTLVERDDDTDDYDPYAAPYDAEKRSYLFDHPEGP